MLCRESFSYKEKLLLWLLGLVLLVSFLYLVRGVLLPFIVAFIVAYFLDPAVDSIQKLKVSRLVATALITAAFFMIVVLISLILIPVLYDQFLVLAQKIPQYMSLLQERAMPYVSYLVKEVEPQAVEKLQENVTGISGYILQLSGKLLENLWQSSMALINILSLVIITPIVTFYLLMDWDTMVAKVDNWLPRRHVDEIRELARRIDDTLSGYIRGQTNVCLLLGAFYAIGLIIVGLESGLLIGMATGVLSFIPYVGMMLGMAIGLGVAFFQFGGWEGYVHIGMVLAVFLVGQFLEGNFITPKLVGKKVHLHPAWIMFGLLAGGALFGFTGVLVAVPVTAVIGVLARYAVAKYLQSPAYSGSSPSGII